MKLLEALFCDDIRFEVNNKLSLMGLYADRLVFRSSPDKELKWPLSVKLASLLRFRFEVDDERPDAFDFEYFINEKSTIKMSGIIKADTSKTYMNLTVMAEGIPLEIGSLGFTVRLMKNDKIVFAEDQKHALKIFNE